MSSANYAIVEHETNPTSAGKQQEQGQLRLVRRDQQGVSDPIIRRVEAVLDFEFAQGHMPA